ncbi:MAG: DUF1579 family protein [Planctomycetota bacterium]
MNIFAKSGLIGLLTVLPTACSSTPTKGSQRSESLGPITAHLSESGRQVDFLRVLEGNYDVIYRVYNSDNADTFIGTAQYEWDGNVLVAQHDSQWNGTPFQSAMLLGYDPGSSCYTMGWSTMDGQMLQPMASVEPSEMEGELSVPRSDESGCSRTVLVLEDSNMHVLRRYVATPSGSEMLVLEMICTRL